MSRFKDDDYQMVFVEIIPRTSRPSHTQQQRAEAMVRNFIPGYRAKLGILNNVPPEVGTCRVAKLPIDDSLEIQIALMGFNEPNYLSNEDELYLLPFFFRTTTNITVNTKVEVAVADIFKNLLGVQLYFSKESKVREILGYKVIPYIKNNQLIDVLDSISTTMH